MSWYSYDHESRPRMGSLGQIDEPESRTRMAQWRTLLGVGFVAVLEIRAFVIGGFPQVLIALVIFPVLVVFVLLEMRNRQLRRDYTSTYPRAYVYIMSACILLLVALAFVGVFHN